MEDILASIRRILNEEEPGQGTEPAGVKPAASAQPAEEEPEALALTEAMLVEPPPAPAPPPGAPPPPSPVTALPPEPVEPPPPVQPVAPPPAEDPGTLLAPAAAAAAVASVSGLLRAVAQERAAPVFRGGPSIEDVVREELRPLLKAWLDTHLPPLVERLVRAEIERVVGRAIGG
ncbi:DUF2497 domain-containing protein [Siccirubricoccus phaeus]|uniref:DUF2497 domain-containing protein n=1 Tax=Siccirubricoccus phaeus TaxID=2595053 RepID=UPI0011F3273D|nr:DUF2497 domain-containing protein [Siccirubricoccus phaeus]